MPTEAGRHRLYETIKEQWGQDNADELMSYLPPVGWADVATKQDLEVLRLELTVLDTKLSAKIDGLGDGLRVEMERGFVRQTRWTLGALLALTTIFTIIVNWLG
jgi:hypothetical protein